MAQFSVKIRHPAGSVLDEKQHFQFWAEFLLMETVRMNVDKHENRPKKPKNKRFQRLLEALEQL